MLSAGHKDLCGFTVEGEACVGGDCLQDERRFRRARHKKDESKASLLYDENMLENDPQRQSKDVAFAQSYLNRVRRRPANISHPPPYGLKINARQKLQAPFEVILL